MAENKVNEQEEAKKTDKEVNAKKEDGKDKDEDEKVPEDILDWLIWGLKVFIKAKLPKEEGIENTASEVSEIQKQEEPKQKKEPLSFDELSYENHKQKPQMLSKEEKQPIKSNPVKEPTKNSRAL